MSYNDLLNFDLSAAEIVAETSSRTPISQNWTELRIYFVPKLRYCFIGEVIGGTTIEGQLRNVRRARNDRLTKMLRWFDKTRLTDDLSIQADVWMDLNHERVREARARPYAPGERQGSDEKIPMLPPVAHISKLKPGFVLDGIEKDGQLAAALTWLYPDETSMNRRVDRLAADFNVPARTVRHSLAKQGAGEELTGWPKAFLSSLRWLNWELFTATRQEQL